MGYIRDINPFRQDEALGPGRPGTGTGDLDPGCVHQQRCHGDAREAMALDDWPAVAGLGGVDYQPPFNDFNDFNGSGWHPSMINYLCVLSTGRKFMSWNLKHDFEWGSS